VKITIIDETGSLIAITAYLWAPPVEEFNISTPSLVFLALFIQARICITSWFSTVHFCRGANPKKLKLE